MQPAFDIASELPDLLATLERPGDFCGFGAVDLPVVHISVDGIGVLGLPIPAVQAEALARIATPAPYGRGLHTVHDPKVRKCGQIAASLVHAPDARWHRVVEHVTLQAAAELGVAGLVSAELYKLLVYQPGDFFTEHRDTEKVPGMFATLVIALPSEHSGGELVVRHDGRESTLSLSGPDVGVARWAAFYTDCQHELRPLLSGYRVALVYNLLRSTGGLPRVPDQRPEITRVADALREWQGLPDSPIKLLYPLKHQYSLAELAFSTLKNEDAAAADVLIPAAAAAACVLRLAMISIHESGSAEPNWETRPSRRWSRYQDDDDSGADDYEVVEVCDSSQTLDGWLRPDDDHEPLGPIPFDDDEVSPPDALADEEPDEDHFHEATGNEGCSFERTYRRAAFVLWPASRELEVLHQGGPEASVAVLERLLGEAEDAERAAEMAKIIVTDWGSLRRRGNDSGALRGRLITALARLPDPHWLRRFLHDVVTVGAFDGGESEALAAALTRFDTVVAGELMTQLAKSCAVASFAKIAAALNLAASARTGPTFAPAVAAAIEAMSTIGERTNAWSADGSALKARPAALIDLSSAVGATGDTKLALGIVEAIGANPEEWPMDAVVVPAALALRLSKNRAYMLIYTLLRRDALEHLRERLALPLAPPPDARRSTLGLTCKCRDCSGLREFLASRVQTVWMLKAIKLAREHIESHIRLARCDVDIRTEARGSPHTLICTKNQASYELLVKRRVEDMAFAARLSTN